MKKQILFLAVLILTLSLLVGCSKNSEQSQNVGEIPSEQKQSAEPLEDGELKVVSGSIYAPNMGLGASTENGYYSTMQRMYATEQPFIPGRTEQSANIMYTDYQQEIKVYLCSVPGCAHNTTSCTSYITYSLNTPRLFTNASGTQLFYLMRTTSATNSNESNLKIFQMDMDGSNRKEIYEFKPNEHFREFLDVIIADNNHLYFGISIVEDAEQEPKHEYRKLNLNTGEEEKLFDLVLYQKVVSVFGRTIVIEDITEYHSDIENFNAMHADYDNHTNFELPSGQTSGKSSYGYSLETNTMTKLYDWTTVNGTVIDNYHFAITKTSDTTANLIVVDISTGEKRYIENLTFDSSNGDISLISLYDNKLLYQYHTRTPAPQANEQDGPTKGRLIDNSYFVDLETGEVSEITLNFQETDGSTSTVEIAAQTNDLFYVVSGIDTENVGRTWVDEQGVSHTFDNTIRYKYAMIDKEDYYNNNPNFRYIEDLT